MKSINPSLSSNLSSNNQNIQFSEKNNHEPRQKVQNQLINHEFGHGLPEDLDCSSSLDLCALKINNPFHLQKSYYTQWEIDAEDAEQKEILEEMFGANFKGEYTDIQNEEGLLESRYEYFKTNNDNQSENNLKGEERVTMSFISPKLWLNLDPNLVQALKQYVEKDKRKENKVNNYNEKAISLTNNKSQTENLGWIYQIENRMGNDNKKGLIKQEKKRNQEHSQFIMHREKSDLFQDDIAAQLGRKQNYEVQFNVMVVGESGIGKSTFIDCFLDKKYNVKDHIQCPTEEIVERRGVRNDNGIIFTINFIDTPGYNYEMDMNKWYSRLEGYITNQFEDYKIKKRNSRKYNEKKYIKDKRVHMILYFTSGMRVKKEDFYYMKNLKKFSNIVPILARGDSYTTEEVKSIKTSFLKEAQEWKLEFFNFHEALKDEKEKLKTLNHGKFGICPPFLIMSSTKKIKINSDQYIYGREYSWGICNAEDPNHSDLSLLQGLLSGYVCYEAVSQVHNCFYKDYFNKRKQEKNQVEEEKKKNVGMCALLALSILGVFAIKQ